MFEHSNLAKGQCAFALRPETALRLLHLWANVLQAQGGSETCEGSKDEESQVQQEEGWIAEKEDERWLTGKLSFLKERNIASVRLASGEE